MSRTGARATRYGVPLHVQAAAHLWAETPDQPTHTVKVLQLQPDVRITHAALVAAVQPRLDRLAVLRRVPHVPRVGLPWWHELDHLDAGTMITHRFVADDAEQRALVGHLLAEHLPRHRPLWRLVLVESPQRQWVVLVTHHALMDGRLAAAVLEALFGDGSPTAVASSSSGTLPRRVERALTWLPRMLALLARWGRSALARIRSPHRAAALAPFAGASRPWNRPLRSARRAYADAVLPRQEWTATARRHGVTFTELALAVSGAAIAHVHGRGEVDDSAVLPFAVERIVSQADASHELAVTSIYFAATGSSRDGPAEALQVVARSARAGIAQVGTGDASLFARQWQVWRVTLAIHDATRAIAQRRSGRAPATLTMSTVRGPSGTLHVAGARVTAIVSGGLLVADLGLNVTVWSTPDAVTFGVVGRPELVDVQVLAEAIGPAFERFATA